MKISLEKTWTECLRMWKWISDVRLKKYGESLHVDTLKILWLTANDYDYNDINNCCFFCNYTRSIKHGCVYPGGCRSCPAQKIDKDFNCCKNPSYYGNPVEFYKLLVELNKKRLSKKGKKCQNLSELL